MPGLLCVALPLLACAAAPPASAAETPITAGATTYDIAIQAQPLARALAQFAQQTGASVGGGVDLRGIAAAPVSGSFTLAESLRRLLAGTGLAFEIIDARTVRLAVAPAELPRAGRRLVRASAEGLEEIQVTATKRLETAGDLPYSISAVRGDQLADIGIRDTRDAAFLMSGVNVTNLGTGRNKIMIRGLSDGVFVGQTQSTVAVYLDDARVTYATPDPNLALVDIDRIEVLRGPQGSLYGAGSIGGIFRVVTRQADLSERAVAAAASGFWTQQAGVGGTAEAMLNLPLATDRLAVRAVAYMERLPGFLDDQRLGRDNTNGSHTEGGRVSVKGTLSDSWSVEAGGVQQRIRSRDAQYYQGELGRNQRGNLLPEPHRNDFSQGHVTAEGDLSIGRLVSSSAMLRHVIASRYDATRNATPATMALPIAFDERTRLRMFTHETRMTSNRRASYASGLLDSQRFDWLGGVFVSKVASFNRSEFLGIAPASPSISFYRENRHDKALEIAAFGELSYALSESVSLTGGLRWFRSTLDVSSQTMLGIAMARDVVGRTTQQGVTPKLLLQYRPAASVMLFAQIAEGYRPGGLNTGLPTFTVANDGQRVRISTRFDADRLWSGEAGAKLSLFDRRLQVNGAFFYTTWDDIQTDQFLSSGLSYTVNAGQGRAYGFEMESVVRPAEGLTVTANLLLAHPSLHNANPLLSTDAQERLPGVPRLSFGLGAAYEAPLSADLTGGVSLNYAYQGSSRLTFDRRTAPKMGPYHVSTAQIFLARDGWRVALFADNLLDDHRNTFAYGNPFILRDGVQVSPQAPRSVGIRLSVKG